MGNCIVHETPLHWAGEDWAPALSQPEPKPESGHVLRPRTELKVKITKKQLEELTRKLDAQAGYVTVQQVVAQLIKASARYENTASWRPRLQTIPEIVSSDSSGSL